MPAVALKIAKVSVPHIEYVSTPKEWHLLDAQLKEKRWLEHARQQLLKDEDEKGDIVA